MGCRVWTGWGQGQGGRRRLRRVAAGLRSEAWPSHRPPRGPCPAGPSEEGKVTRVTGASRCGADAAWSLQRRRVEGGVVSPGNLGSATKIALCNLCCQRDQGHLVLRLG